MNTVANPIHGVDVCIHDSSSVRKHLPRFESFARRREILPLSLHPGWLAVLADGLGHAPYCLEVARDGQTQGLLPLSLVRSLLFGRYLVSLPYLNSGGVMADDENVAQALISRAISLSEELNVRHLELRHEQPISHPDLNGVRNDKVHMRMDLPARADKLWEEIPAKVRNQVRKGQKSHLAAAWGGVDLLADFYRVFSHNMRDLGTPVYSRRLFRAILSHFPDRAEICVVRAGSTPVAAALLLHGWGVTEVPSASSLRAYNPLCANMLLYWELLARAIERGQRVFDFGRSTRDGSTYRFKKQWGAVPADATWQYYVRQGSVGGMRREHPRFQKFIRVWQKMPVCLTRWLGPMIVRGIP